MTGGGGMRSIVTQGPARLSSGPVETKASKTVDRSSKLERTWPCQLGAVPKSGPAALIELSEKGCNEVREGQVIDHQRSGTLEQGADRSYLACIDELGDSGQVHLGLPERQLPNPA